MKDCKQVIFWCLVVALGLGLSACACGGGGDDAKPSSEEKKEKDDDDGDKEEKTKKKKGDKKDGEDSFEDQVKASKPLKPKTKSQKAGSRTIKAELCKIEGREFLGKSTSGLFKAVQAIDGRLLVVDGEGQIHGFKTSDKGGCTLKVDKSFGKKGVLKLKDKIEYLSADKSGKVVASHGIFNAYVIEGGEEVASCKTGGYIELHSSGKWGIAPWVNSTVKVVEFKDKTCTTEPWVLQDLSNDGKRKGDFSNVNTSAIVGDKIIIGGILAKSVNAKEPRVVVAFDRKGKEAFRFGNTEESFKDDGFGWFHAIQGCEAGICVLDSNFRKISLWDDKGGFIGAVKLKELLGLNYPWLADFTVAKGGEAYMVATQNRDDSKVVEGFVYRIEGL